MMPLYSVEKPGLRKMLQVFDPQYDLPGRKYFSQTAIPLLYDSLREKIVSELREIDHFAATADMWSSHTGEPYLAYTIHFINADWKLESRVLQASYLPQDHNAENIVDAFSSTLRLKPSQQVHTVYSSMNQPKLRCAYKLFAFLNIIEAIQYMHVC